MEQREAGRWMSEDYREGRKTIGSGVSLKQLERLMKSQTFVWTEFMLTACKERIVLQTIFEFGLFTDTQQSKESFCQFRKDNH